ncbi:ABC-three component system protein [Planktotalea sp.]|uniref:ABC-three component system protein n=1 Tax=Planktotalea sp. TaxID=2029877 RepID=UPI003F6BD585
MDELQRYIYQLKFENAFLKNQGQAFEDMFSRIMGHAHAGDFQAVRPYGNKGDLKCDGYRASDKTVFQCYAPRSTKLDAMQKKVDADFNGAVGHWGNRMERWVFVHNDDAGLPADVTQQLIDLGAANSTVTLGQMSYTELFAIVMVLTQPQLVDLFGAAPTQTTLARLEFVELQPVITSIQRMEPDDNPPLTAPSPAKLQANDLSEAAAGLLRQGRRKEQLVERFLNQYPDPSFGEEIAQGFRDRYKTLRSDKLQPDIIFAELQQFAGGMTGLPERQAAVLAVMSYFFERCDIFEDQVEQGTTS